MLNFRKTVLKCIAHVAIPLLDLCIRNAVTIQELQQIIKHIYVQRAKLMLERRGEKPSIMRISAISGIARRDVAKLYEAESLEVSKSGVVSKVIATWLDTPKYIDSAGEPKPLTIRGAKSQFHRLVKKVSQDVSPRSVLDHLQNTEVIKIIEGRAVLQVRGYAPTGNIDESFHFLSLDIDDLIHTVEDNVYNRNEIKNLHATTEYLELDSAHQEEVKEWILREGTKFHRELRKFLGQYDVSNMRGGDGKPSFRFVFGTFSRTED